MGTVKTPLCYAVSQLSAFFGPGTLTQNTLLVPIHCNGGIGVRLGARGRITIRIRVGLRRRFGEKMYVY